MIDMLKLAAVFILIVALLRRKLPVGWVMFAGAATLALLYRMTLGGMGAAMATAFYGHTTLEFLSALMLIRVLEHVMRERELLARMMSASRAYLKSRRAGIVAMPILIGLLPSVGGAYFSAPMVDEAARDTGMSAEEKGFVNFWFRHLWELTLPLYPGLLLAVAVSGIGLRTLVAANAGCAIVMLITGFVFSMRELGGAGAERPAKRPGEFWSFAPIVAVLVMVMAFNVQLYVAMAVSIAGLYLVCRMGWRAIWASLRAGFSWDLVVLICGVMLFKSVMEGAGAVASLSQSFSRAGIPLMAVLFALPFVTGLLTGFTIGFVGATFPLLVSLDGGATLSSVSFAFASGYMGVLLSPVHVCFVLTRDYFKAELGASYRRLALPVALTGAYAVAQYFLLTLRGY